MAVGQRVVIAGAVGPKRGGTPVLDIRRREFITLLGGAAAAPSLLRPMAAHAQQGERMRRIGVLMPFAEDNPVGQARLAAFRQGLLQLGRADGRNLRIDTRWGAGDASLIRTYSRE